MVHGSHAENVLFFNPELQVKSDNVPKNRMEARCRRGMAHIMVGVATQVGPFRSGSSHREGRDRRRPMPTTE